MSLASLLGFGGNMSMGQPLSPDQLDALPFVNVGGQRQQGHGGALKIGSPLRDFLGALGDYSLMRGGRDPVYQGRRQRERSGSALSQYLGDADPMLAQLLQADPETGLAAYKARHPASETPAALKEFQYYQGLQGPARSAYEQFLKLTHPGMMTPFAMETGGSFELPDQTSGLPIISTPDEAHNLPPGTRFRMPDGRVGTVPGGQ